MTQWFYEKNTEFLGSPVNKTFEEVLWMSKEEFRQWVIDLRKEVTRLWDEHGQPPRVGFSKSEIAEQFNDLQRVIPGKILARDMDTGVYDVLHNTFVVGNAVNQFFPTMMKTRINYTKDVNAGKSIYDYFAQDELLDTFITYASRHFKRDSFYSYSTPVRASDNSVDHIPYAATGNDWIVKFESEKYRTRKKVEYWLCPVSEDTGYSGYNEELRTKSNLRITRSQIETLGPLIPEQCKTNVDWDRSEVYEIRVFTKGQKLFPVGLKAFRVSFCQYAVNFPPLVAKYIYETYTKEWKNEENIYVWDPSSGWGGRLLGALSTMDTRHLVYLGNDPNTDHNTTPGRTKYHEIVDFFREHVKPGSLVCPIDHIGFQFWQKGSEEMQFDPEFQKYQGKLSLVFTSPPYFAKEAYSNDPNQSYRRFSQYDAWRDGFLKKTLQTAVLWLRPGGYLAWNIADAVFSGENLPLEKDSCDILEQLGMKHVETLKMTLAQTPGGNRVDETTGKPKFKNSCRVERSWRKFEPIYIFQKPK